MKKLTVLVLAGMMSLGTVMVSTSSMASERHYSHSSNNVTAGIVFGAAAGLLAGVAISDHHRPHYKPHYRHRQCFTKSRFVRRCTVDRWGHQYCHPVRINREVCR